ncbi:MAG: outer membrane protein [Lysobacterales bacterium]|nr:MAG: outer membrane protein [Xanthomonadales bacterium]
MSKRNTLAWSISVALLGAYGVPAMAQEDQAELDKIQVTGTRIKRAEVEGALPVTVIDREQIELSGDLSVADFLRNIPFNTFGSFRPQSGSSAQSFAGLSLRGLGEGRTLILIDGRRAPTAPNIGSAQDLNIIPLAAVERIEILSDGASAIYGTDAIGGVVNIITRKDFNGVEISGGAGNPKRPGGETEFGSVIFGSSGERSRVLLGAGYSNRGIVWQRDREWSRGGISTFSNNFITAIAAPGTLYGFRPGGFLAHPTNGSVVPGGCSGPGFSISGTGASTRCFYDLTFVAADEAEIRNSALFGRAAFQINDDWSTYFNAMVSRVESFGRYAPVPSSPWPGDLPFIPVGSPNHPAVRFPGAGYNPNVPVFLRHRFAALGNRDTSTDNNLYDFILGFEGRVGPVELDVGVRHTDSQYYDLGRNYVVGAIAQQFIQTGRYNIYDPFNNPRDVLDAMIATINRDGRLYQQEAYAIGNVEDLFELTGGTVGAAFGIEWRKEQYQDFPDTLTLGGQILGLGEVRRRQQAERTMRAVFFEFLFPVLENFEVNVAGRYDRYSDFGSAFSPKASFRFQAMENLTLRASYGEGFRAPTLAVQGTPIHPRADTFVVPCPPGVPGPITCLADVAHTVIVDPALDRERSRHGKLGFAWQPFPALELFFDAFAQRIEDEIRFFDIATVFRCARGLSGQVCPERFAVFPVGTVLPDPRRGLGVILDPATRDPLGGQAGFGNGGRIEVSGFDLGLEAKHSFPGLGELAGALTWSSLSRYERDGGANLVGDPGHPRHRALLALVFSRADWTMAWNIHYLHSTRSLAGARARAGLNDYGYPHKLPSWTIHDLQVNWNAPWDGRITLGVQNLADKDPPLDPLLDRGFDFDLYDGYGRIPYIRYTQQF